MVGRFLNTYSYKNVKFLCMCVPFCNISLKLFGSFRFYRLILCVNVNHSCSYVTIGDGWKLGGNEMFSGVSLDDNTYDNSSGIQSNLHYVTSQANSEIWC
jgi:hypothetical protein